VTDSCGEKSCTIDWIVFHESFILYIPAHLGRSFRRVLPLPSDLWEEFGGSVFCHYHEHDSGSRGDGGMSRSVESSPKRSVLVPKNRDCLANSDRFLVTDQSLDWDRIDQVPQRGGGHSSPKQYKF